MFGLGFIAALLKIQLNSIAFGSASLCFAVERGAEWRCVDFELGAMAV
jgi:hypothetical protein